MSFIPISVILIVFVGTVPKYINGQSGYDTKCTCNTVSSGVCTQFSCSTTTVSGSTKCFSGSSEVTLHDGSHKALSEVQVGDKVLTYENNTYEPIMAFIHIERNNYYEFLSIDIQSIISNGTSTIAVSPNHLIFDFDSRNARFAGAFRIGDRLQFVENSQIVPAMITNIRLTRQKGFYAPLTRSGTVVINGVVASNYASVSNHDLAHIVMGVYRMYTQLISISVEHIELSWILKVLLKIQMLMEWTCFSWVTSATTYDGKFQISGFL